MKTNEIIRRLCSLQGISLKNLEIELGFSGGSLSKDSVYLRSDRLLAAAQRLGVSMECLMDVDDIQRVPLVTPEEMDIIRRYRALDDRGRGAVEAVLDRESKYCADPQKEALTNAV